MGGIDLHYYPQETNVALTSDDSAATAALRLRSLKSLYDPTYVDESWIANLSDNISLCLFFFCLVHLHSSPFLFIFLTSKTTINQLKSA